MSSVNVTLNIFDEDGIQVDTTNMDLSQEQVSDIVDHAAQLAIVRRGEADGDADLVLADLEEALVAAGVINPSD